VRLQEASEDRSILQMGLRITWFNSVLPPLRGNQNAQTLVDMIQIGQWYNKHDR